MKITRRRYSNWGILDDLLGEGFENIFNNGAWVVTSQLGSPISHKVSQEGLEVTFQVPGYDSSELELTADGGALYVRDVVHDSDAKHCLSLSFGLPEGVDYDSITSKCEKGILTVNAKFERLKSDKQTIKID